MDGEKAATEKIGKLAGHEGHREFGLDDKKVFDTAFKAVAEDWVKDIDKRGKPGSEVLQGLHRGPGRATLTGPSLREAALRWRALSPASESST